MSANTVRKRHVFYLSGFDPRGVRHYHPLYKSEAESQAAVSGVRYDVSSRRKVAPHVHRWDVTTPECQTAYDFLGWDDIIRKEWAADMTANLKDVWAFFRHYFLNGHVWKFGRDRLQPLIPIFYPFVLAVATLALCVAAAISLVNALPNMAGVVAAIAAACGIFYGGFLIGRNFAAFWMLRICIFNLHLARNQVPAMKSRLKAFSKTVSAALRDPAVDEVLVVGHSVGGVIAVPMLADVLRETPDTEKQKLSFLTLGSCIPLVSYWKTAQDYRDDLAYVANDPHMGWVDYTAKTDAITFYMLDPVKGSGLVCDRPDRPLLLSPRFFKLFRPETYRRMRFNWYKMHFLYLMAGEIPGAYDYFRLTAGPAKLAEAAR